MLPETQSPPTESSADEEIKSRLKAKGFELGSRFLYRDLLGNRDLLGTIVGCNAMGSIIVQTYPPLFTGVTDKNHYSHIGSSFHELAKKELCFTATSSKMIPLSEAEYQQKMSPMTPEEVKIENKAGHWVKFLRLDGQLMYYKVSAEIIKRSAKIEIFDGKIHETNNDVHLIKIDGKEHGFEKDAVFSMENIPEEITNRIKQLEDEQLLISAYNIKVGEPINYFDTSARVLVAGVVDSVSNKDGEFSVMINPAAPGPAIKVPAEHIFVPGQILKGLNTLTKNKINWGVNKETPEGNFRLLFAEEADDGADTLLFFDRPGNELYIMTLNDFLAFGEKRQEIMKKDLKIEQKLAEAGLKIGDTVGKGKVVGFDFSKGTICLQMADETWYNSQIAHDGFHSAHTVSDKTHYGQYFFSQYKNEKEMKEKEEALKRNDTFLTKQLKEIGFSIGDKIIVSVNEVGSTAMLETTATVVGYQRGLPVLHQTLTDFKHAFNPGRTDIHSQYKNLANTGYATFSISSAIVGKKKYQDQQIVEELGALGLSLGDKLLINNKPATIIGYNAQGVNLEWDKFKGTTDYKPAGIHSSFTPDPYKTTTYGSLEARAGKAQYETQEKENFLNLLKEKEERERLEQEKLVFNGIKVGDTVYNHYISYIYPYEYTADRTELKVLSLNLENKTCQVKTATGTKSINAANLFKDTPEFTPFINQMMIDSRLAKEKSLAKLAEIVKEKDLKVGDWVAFDNEDYLIQNITLNSLNNPMLECKGKDEQISQLLMNNVTKLHYSNSGLKIGDKVRFIRRGTSYPYPVECREDVHFEITGFNRHLNRINTKRFLNNEPVNEDYEWEDKDFYLLAEADKVAQRFRSLAAGQKLQDDQAYEKAIKEKGISKGDTLISTEGNLFQVVNLTPVFFSNKPLIQGVYKSGSDKSVKSFWLADSKKPNQAVVLKDNAKTALYRVGATQAVNIVKAALITLMQNRNNPESIMQGFANFLKTEMGTAFTATVASLALQQFKPDDRRIVPLIKELQIQAMATAGNAVLDTLAAEVVPLLKNVFQDLEESEKRIGATAPSMLGSEDQEEYQAEECSALPQVAVK